MQNIVRHMDALLQPQEDYRLVVWLFIKSLAVVYFIAFLSLGVQVLGLVGSQGILPFVEALQYRHQSMGATAYFVTPTLFWLGSSDLMLQLACYAGCVTAGLLFLGRLHSRTAFIILFVLYLSLFHAGQTFLSFQWDSLLLETGFLAMFLTAKPSRLLLLLFHWLLFRLRFMSGYAKLASGDPLWSNMTALEFYFETQPLPHWGAWYFHQFPEWLLLAGVLLVFFTELLVPFLMFMPRRFRLFAAAITISMQLIIIATSNHNWINLLTIVLCLFLLDDRLLKVVLPGRSLTKEMPGIEMSAGWSRYLLPVFALVVISSSVLAFTHKFTPVDMPQSVKTYTGVVRSWGIGHIFHLFPTMQGERHELQIEGSDDGKQWKVYEFRYKPGALDRAPVFNVPHQPRLDWMLWFVPPRSAEMMHFFDAFMYRLHEGSDDVLDLLASNPFPDGAPEYQRVLVFRYRFTDAEERARSGDWWRREYLGQFPYVRPRYP